MVDTGDSATYAQNALGGVAAGLRNTADALQNYGTTGGATGGNSKTAADDLKDGDDTESKKSGKEGGKKGDKDDDDKKDKKEEEGSKDPALQDDIELTSHSKNYPGNS